MSDTKIKNDLKTEDLIQEVLSGEYKKDVLPNSALEFTGEHQAMYFSNMRRNIISDMAYSVINDSPSLYELHILKSEERF